MSAGALALILMLLVSFDSRVREQVELRLSSPSTVVSDASHGVKSLTAVVMRRRRLVRAGRRFRRAATSSSWRSRTALT